MNNTEVLKREETYWENLEEFEWLTESSILEILTFIPQLSKTSNILELCSGSGMFTTRMKIDFKTYTCVDISQRLLDKLKSNNPKITIIKDNAENPKLQANSYDCIFVFAGLHHLPNLKKTYKNSYKLLKSDGLFFAFEPNNICIYRKPMLWLKNVMNIYTEDEHFLNPIEMKQMLEAENFKDIKIEYITPKYNKDRFSFFVKFLDIFVRIASSITHSSKTQTFFIITGKK